MKDQSKALRAVFVVTLGFFLMLAIVSYSRIDALLDSEQNVNRTAQVSLEMEKIIGSLKDAETGQRGYLLTRDTLFLEPYNNSLAEYPIHLERLKHLIRDNPQQQKNLQRLETLGAQHKDYLRQMLAAGPSHPPTAQQMLQGQAIMDSLRSQVITMANLEQAQLQERRNTLRRDRLLAPATILALSIAAFLVLLLAYWQLNRALKNAQQLKDKIVKQTVDLEKRKELQTIFSQTPTPIAVVEAPNHTFIQANRFYQKLYNRTEAQLLGKTIREAFPEVAGQGIFEIFDRVLLTGEPYISEEFFAKWDKEQNGVMVPAWFNFIAQPIKNEEGRVLSIMLHTIDITEQLESRKKIEENEHRYASMIYSSPLIVAILEGKELLLKIGNDSLLDHLGKGKGIIGKPYLEANPELEEQGIGNILREVYRTGVPFQTFETPVYLIRNGIKESRYYNYLVQPQRTTGGIIEGIAITATEVTAHVELNNKVKESEHLYRELALSLEQKIQERTDALKQSEEKFNALFQLSPQGLVFSDATGKYLMINENFTKIFGFTQPEAVGKTSLELAVTPLALRERIIEEMKKNGSINNMEAEMRKKSGEIVPVLFSVVVINIGDQQYFLSAANDNTERKKAEEEIKQNNLELKKMNEELASFAYISSHDLQEPLRKIQMFTGLLMEKEIAFLSDGGRDIFSKIQRTAGRMQQLINDLLLYSRTNNAQRKFETADLHQLMNEVKEELKEDIKEKHATIEFTGMSQANIIPFQFRQLMHNLIGNALKFSDPARPPHIRINTEIATGLTLNHPKLARQNKYCHITVSDNGIGFEPQYNEHIFGVFQRLHGRSEYAGTGIGLSIAKKIVENHDGIITAHGQLNKGATFEIYIPVT